VAVDPVLNISDMRSLVASWKSAGHKVAFVPTMGALHEGHLSLVRAAKTDGAKVVVSIFVNPLQFGPTEDFSRYPRTLKDDIEKLRTVDADAVFAPAAAEIYPDGFQTVLLNEKMASGLCGRFRPGHFSGVLTVVAKLFNIVLPDVAYFGKKDYQQWRLIERMVLDLQMPLNVVGFDTIRESDGLAMSSRNRYMSPEERERASLIYQGLSVAKDTWQSGERSSAHVMSRFTDMIAKCDGMRIQYAEIVDRHTLEPCGSQLADKSLVMIVAVMYGDVRLIDNLEF
jgi:pantoate--beta-alanine ligase